MVNLCTQCHKECKDTNSRPYPNPKSSDRIHIRCHIKKTLTDRRTTLVGHRNNIPDTKTRISSLQSREAFAGSSRDDRLFDRVYNQADQVQSHMRNQMLSKVISGTHDKSQPKDNNTSNQFFFDVKAGIAKPHEKRRFLNHRNISEIAARYDDQGFHSETVGRAYDHTGKDLMTLGDDDCEDEKSLDRDDQPPLAHQKRPNQTVQNEEINFRHHKRKLEATLDSRDCSKKINSTIDEQSSCWFCLSSSKVEKHLIICIGEHCYLTLAKGGLVDEHLLIVPIDHIDCIASEENSKELDDELKRFKRSLQDYFALTKRGVIFFERNFKSMHWQLQVVPISLDKIKDADKLVKELSKDLFSNSNYMDIPRNCSLADMIPPRAPYLYWEIEPLEARFVTQVKVKGAYFPVQLGRQVLSDRRLLNCSSKVDWKKCVKTEAEYKALVTVIKENYKEFDFT